MPLTSRSHSFLLRPVLEPPAVADPDKLPDLEGVEVDEEERET